MRKVSKILLILTICAICIVMSFTLKSFAAENDNYSITVTGDVANKEFYLIKLFSLNVDGNNYIYSWDDTTEYARNYFTGIGYDTAEKAAAYLSNFYDNQYELMQFADNIFNENGALTHKKADSSDNPVTFTGLEQGYYLVYDNTILNDVPRSCAMLKSLQSGENVVSLKSSKISLTKSISTSSIENGEEAVITLHMKYPNTIGYRPNDFIFRITEQLSDGLEYKEGSARLRFYNDYPHNIDGRTLQDVYDSTNNTLTMDIGFYDPVNAGNEFYVEYVVTRKYVDGNFDNTSTTTLEFSADPTNLSKTEKIENVVVHTYTYKLNFIKTNVFGECIDGVQFRLRLPDATWAVVDENGVFLRRTFEDYEASVIDVGSDGKFSISGLKADSGYRLEELITNPEYSLPNFSFDFDIVEYIDDNGILTQSMYDFKTDDFNPIAVGFSKNVIAERSSDISLIELVNVKAVELPSTGGIGTKVFKIVGFTLMTIAVLGISLVLIKKKSYKED